MRTCAVEEVGEICVANPGVFPGSTYTEADKNHDLFAEGRFLRTGDLGRKDSDGYLWITGRAKDLIIRGGHNIFPTRVEDLAIKHPAVARAAAFAVPDERLGEKLCLAVLPAGPDRPAADEVLRHLFDCGLSKYDMPEYFLAMDAFPLTASGKILKRELRG